MSPTTIRRVHATLRHALADAVEWGLIVRNPADSKKAKPAKASTTEAAVWSAEELGHFLTFSQENDERGFPLWVLLAASGLRRGEALALRWRDVDLDAARVTVRRALIANGHALDFQEPKTNNGRRTVPLHPATVAAIRGHRTAQLEERMMLGLGRATADDLVFATVEGKPLHPNTITKRFRALVRAAGLPEVRLHGLRHGFASLAIREGVDIRTVAGWLGHFSPSFTVSVYGHVMGGQDEAAAKVGRAIFG